MMTDDLLARITKPADVRGLSHADLARLAQDLRAEMIAATSINGGHLASSLGAVELILAAYRTMDLPHDKLVFDVGHQAYAHKMLTGRLSGFAALRQMGGTSGFTRRSESPYDVHDSGHASDSLAIALGLAVDRDRRGGDERIMAIVGDASVSGGLAFEAINLIGQMRKKRFVIVLNDNEMSISHTIGALSSYLASIRTSRPYITTRDAVEGTLSRTGIGAGLVKLGEMAKASTKQLLVPGMLFEEYGFMYLGPIDGHDVSLVQATMERAFAMDGPVVIHAVTKKGKGYLPAERNPELFHGVGPFDLETGVPVKKTPHAPTYTSVFSRTLVAEAREDARIVAITAAMKDGTGLATFAKEFTGRFVDVGIAEECAVTMAAGLAIGGSLPVVAIYSTFLQLAYDEIVTNVCLPNLHVVFAIDRAGLVGQDGATHHGALDMAFLRAMPNMRILAPSDEAELADAIHTAIRMDGPVAVRYPRGEGTGVAIPAARTELVPGVSRELRPGGRVRFLAVGRMVGVAGAAADLLAARGVSAGVTDMRWVKPVDEAAVRAACADEGCELVVTLEDGNRAGGFGSAVLEVMADAGLHKDVLRLGLPDRFVGHGAAGDLFASIGLDPAGVADAVAARLAERAGAR